jgi:hypothetical protein
VVLDTTGRSGPEDRTPISSRVYPSNLAGAVGGCLGIGLDTPYIFERIRPIEQPTIESTDNLSFILYL